MIDSPTTASSSVRRRRADDLGERAIGRSALLPNHVSGALVAAFTLSLVHTVYAAVAGIADPDFTVTSPLAWGFYAVGFAVALVARRDDRRVQWAVAAYLVVLLAVSIFVYPTTFVPAHQTVFGWFENDVYVALLGVGLYLDVLVLRGWTLISSRDAC